jgi:hypothetical protein
MSMAMTRNHDGALLRKPDPGEVPTIDLVVSDSKANTLPLLKRFVARTDELVARARRNAR